MDEVFEPGARVAVLTAQPLDRFLDYLAPEEGVCVGDYVEVPLGPRKVMGVVWGPGQGDFAASKLRPILRRMDLVPMQPEMQAFLTKVGDYTLTPLTQMFRMATRAPGLGEPPGTRRVYRRGTQTPDRLTDARARVLDVFTEYGDLPFALGELAETAGVSSSVVKGLVKLGAVVEQDAPRDVAYPPLDPNRPGKTLTEAQSEAAMRLRMAQRTQAYGTTLLKGVTGSGKTEVYMEAVAECLAQGRQALVLLPEIALTAEFLTRVEARFGARPAEWHYGATQAERRRCWRMVSEGGAQLVVGARSALFLPFQNLGLIVVDEEHDTSYKQDEGVLYNARDMSVLRASLNQARVILASATPSLETWVNAEQGKYDRVDLASRYGAAILPRMGAIDMRSEDLPASRWISPSLRAQVQDRMAKGEQSLLFLNRRGYAPVTVCRACGHQIACHDCDARMVEHRFLKRLVCHQCGADRPMPEKCPSCEVEGKLAPVGPGVERLAEEAAEAFPDARIAVLSSDLYSTARQLKEQIEAIAKGDADILIGTQLVAKGHNFPQLTLVGVIDADLGLQGADLRAAERSFQLMRQVSGRAGRADTPGVALLQTFQPDHPVMRAILHGDEEAFWRAEAAEREAAGVPPYGRMAGIILSGPSERPLFDLGLTLARNDGPLRAIGAQLFGPAPAPIARIRGRFRVRLLVKAPKSAPLQQALRAWTSPLKLPNNTRLAIDIDPQNFF